MRRPRLSLFVLLFLLTAVLVHHAFAVEKSVFLPKGTTVEKTDEGCLKFTLPDGCAVQVKGFMKTGTEAVVTGQCGTIGDCTIVSGKGKLIATGKEGKILSGEKPASGTDDPAASLSMDGSRLWLPAVVQFEDARIFDRLALEKLAEEPGK
jgi:hypothetical protein